jgi:hypothetical protein
MITIKVARSRIGATTSIRWRSSPRSAPEAAAEIEAFDAAHRRPRRPRCDQAANVGAGKESLRQRVLQAQTDAAERPVS